MLEAGAMLRSTLFSILLVSALGCSDKKSSSEPEPAPPANAPAPATAPAAPAAPAAAALPPAEEARNTFNTLCSTCHGTSGKGDGTAAASLNPKPRDYTDKAWQASVTDDDLKKIIVEGGAAVGKSQLMPPNPQLKDKPEVVAELVKIVRSFAQ